MAPTFWEQSRFRDGWGPHGGLNPNGRQYRKFAECCEQLAKWDDLEEHRSSLMEMAQLWRELAEETKDAG